MRREDRIPQPDNHDLDLELQMQRCVIDNVRSGVIVLDSGGSVVSQNQSALQIFGANGSAASGSFYQSPYAERCPLLLEAWQQAMADVAGEPRRFQCRISLNNEDRILEILVRPQVSGDGVRTGCVIVADDISAHVRLRTTIEELERTGEQLHSANEELETTNEQLQSTNEELETANEELHSLKEELETANDELERRRHELEENTTRYAKALAQIPSPIAVVNDASEIQLWNPAAERFFNLQSKWVVGLSLKQLPFTSRLRNMLMRRHEGVLRSLKPAVVRDVKLELDGFEGRLNLRFTPISGAAGRGVLIVFDPQRSGRDARGNSRGGRSPAKSANKVKNPGTRGAASKKRGKRPSLRRKRA